MGIINYLKKFKRSRAKKTDILALSKN